VDRVSIERICAGREFQVEGADTEKAREEKLLVIAAGLVRRFVLEEGKYASTHGRTERKHTYCCSLIGNESVPIQLAQCWFPGLAISNAKI